MNPTVDKAMLAFLRVHDKVYQATNGWVGHRLPFAPPSLLLHSTGAKTGRKRTNSLTYARDGETYLIVASNGGAPRNPAWYHNLKAHPRVQVNVGPRRLDVTARVVMPGDDDYDRLWRIVNANNADRYRAYQKRTSRPIPVIVLEP